MTVVVLTAEEVKIFRSNGRAIFRAPQRKEDIVEPPTLEYIV
jgi:hypothetical protein